MPFVTIRILKGHSQERKDEMSRRISETIHEIAQLPKGAEGWVVLEDVTQEGWYSITTLYTSRFGGHISLDVNGVDATGPLEIPSTFVAADTVEWRQAHHWNRVAGLGRFRLPAGKHLLTLHFLDHPVMNFDYMEFVRVP